MCVGLQSTCGTKSQGSTSIDDDIDDEVYRVLVLGGPGVGKSAITQQFLTSEYMAAQNTSFGQFHVRLMRNNYDLRYSRNAK